MNKSSEPKLTNAQVLVQLWAGIFIAYVAWRIIEVILK